MKKIITVDGPAGSGKEKISKYISKKYKLFHIDSGILYRRLAYELNKSNIKVKEQKKIKRKIREIAHIPLKKLSALRLEEIGYFCFRNS